MKLKIKISANEIAIISKHGLLYFHMTTVSNLFKFSVASRTSEDSLRNKTLGSRGSAKKFATKAESKSFDVKLRW